MNDSSPPPGGHLGASSLLLTDEELLAIRKRDTDWRPNGSRGESAKDDRRLLLRHIDALENDLMEIAEDTQRDLASIRSVLRDERAKRTGK